MQYFAKQTKIYPRRVWGKFRKLKWLAMVLLLGIYYITPWLRWDRGEHAPDQAILIDMAGRRAYFFGIEIWPQEVYYLAGLLILAAVVLFFITSLLGRVWCGYACPQTVWTDLFVWVERIVQGDRNTRKKLDESPWYFKKCYKKILTHAIWLLIGLCTGGAWVFYFNDAPTLGDQILHLDVPRETAIWILGLTFSTYLMAGFAREQVCTYMCPYSRFQSAMFDKDTLIIAYDQKRGEPRGKHKAGSSWEGKGHCINCDSCVVVCPMGIDIRNGLQMECIACGLCVDACNNVMDKIGLPLNLIRYSTQADSEGKASSILRFRTFYYIAVLLAIAGFMLYSLLTRLPLELTVQHDRNPLYVPLSDGTIRNGYTINILNKTLQDRSYSLKVKGLENIKLSVQGNTLLPTDNLSVFADSIGHFRLFIVSTPSLEKRRNITLEIQDNQMGLAISEDSIFITGVGE